jgi:hypothetical protein
MAAPHCSKSVVHLKINDSRLGKGYAKFGRALESLAQTKISVRLADYSAGDRDSRGLRETLKKEFVFGHWPVDYHLHLVPGNQINPNVWGRDDMVPGQCGAPRRTLMAMADRTYLVALKPPYIPLQHVVAATIEVHGEHLVFLAANGKLAALFLLDVVQSWNVLETGSMSKPS